MKPFHNKKLLVNVGAGGVGKTSISALCGIVAARQKKDTLIVTIDPAKRLANAFGLESLCPTPESVSDHFKAELDISKKTSLYLMMLDMPQAWDDLILRIYGQGEKSERIFENRFYHYLSRELAGSQELIACDALLELHRNSLYDFIVLDTPPSAHAVDFLDAPERILGFLANETVLGFLKKHGKNLSARGGKLVAQAGGLMQSAVEKIVGKGFLSELVDFFILLQELIEPIVDRTKSFADMLRSEDTAFQIICAPDSHSTAEALALREALQSRKYPLLNVLANRVTPLWPLPSDTEQSPILGMGTDSALKIVHDYAACIEVEKSILTKFESKLNKVPLVRVPCVFEDINQIVGLNALLPSLSTV